ncbi:MAG: acetyltransferase [Planctomycetota bacterium]
MLKRKLVIFGSNTAQEVHEAAMLSHNEEYMNIARQFFDEKSFEGDGSRIESDCDAVDFHVGIADLEWKQRVVEACRRRGWTARSIVHPNAIVAPSASIGVGSFIGPLAVISSNATIGEHCIIHIHCSIGHDASIGNFCAVLPGARISGKVQVGHGTIIGSNAFVFQGISIGVDCQVDALSYVGRDLAENHLVSPRSNGPVRRIRT